MWMDTLVLIFFVPTSLIGIYEICWRISGVLFFGATAIAEVSYPEISAISKQTGSEVEIRRLIRKGLKYSGIIAIPGFFGAVVLGEAGLSLYGREYTTGYVVLLILIVSRIFHSYETVSSKSLNGLDLPKRVFRTNLVFIPLNLALNIILIYQFGWVGAAVATASSMLVKLVQSVIYLDRRIRINIPVDSIMKQTFGAIVMAVLVVLANRYASLNQYVEFAALVTFGILVYVVTLSIMEPYTPNQGWLHSILP